MHVGALAALIIAWWLLKGIDAGVQQAKTEVSRFREEYKVLRKEVRETVDKGTRAGRSVFGTARAAWRGMKGAPRGAGAFARKTAAGTGPFGRVFRAARAGGALGAAAARQARAWSRRSAAASAGASAGPGRGRPRLPKTAVCAGGCGLPALLTALTRLPDGRRVCGQCLADYKPPQAPSPQDAASRPASAPWDADIVPPPAVTAPGQAPEPVRPASPARTAVPVPAPAPAAQPVPQAPPAPPLPAAARPQASPAPLPRFLAPAVPGPAQVPARTAEPAAFPERGTVPAIPNGEQPMTTPSLPAVPARGLPARPGGANGGESGNHGQWLAACDAQRQRAERLTEQQHAMLASLHSVDGREQVTEITEWAGRARQYAVAVTRMVATVNPPEQQLISAVSGAGGPQNIPDMTYFGE